MISFFVGALCISFVLKGFFFFSSWISGCKLEDCLSSLVGIWSHHLGRQFQVYLLYFFFFCHFFTKLFRFRNGSWSRLSNIINSSSSLSLSPHCCRHCFHHHHCIHCPSYQFLVITVSSLYHARMCVDMRCRKRCKLPLAPDNVVG